MPPTDRIRAATSAATNDRIDRESLRRLRRYADRGEPDFERQLARLEREWDLDRVVELNAAAIGLAGLALGIAHNRRWLALPGIVFSCLALHAMQGWCPPVPLLRRLGVRTRREIERERYAMKGVRGDFDGARGRTQAAWRAVRS